MGAAPETLSVALLVLVCPLQALLLGLFMPALFLLVDVTLGGAGIGMSSVLLHKAFIDAAVELGGDARVSPPVGRCGTQLLLLVLGVIR